MKNKEVIKSDITFIEACQILQKSRKTISQYIRKGLLTPERIKSQRERIKMPINEYGFLGKEIKQYEDNLLAKYNEVFDFYEEFNHFLHKIHDKTGLKNDDFQGAMITRTFTKSLTTFQAIYKLFRYYFCNNAENLCRVLFEEMVNVCYCVLGINEAKRFYSLEIINALKIISEVNNPKNKEYFTESDKEK